MTRIKINWLVALHCCKKIEKSIPLTSGDNFNTSYLKSNNFWLVVTGWVCYFSSHLFSVHTLPWKSEILTIIILAVKDNHSGNKRNLAHKFICPLFYIWKSCIKHLKLFIYSVFPLLFVHIFDFAGVGLHTNITVTVIILPHYSWHCFDRCHKHNKKA